MNFLKKIFAANQNKSLKEKRATARAESNTKVTISFPSLGQKISVRNISVTGVAIDTIADLSQLGLDLQLSAQLKILEKPFNIEVKVVRRTDFIIALNFLKPPAELIQEISRVFLLEFNAQTIQYIGAEKLQAVADGTPHWYYGGENYELYYIEKNDQILSFHLKILSDTIDKKFGKNISFGRIWSDNKADQDEAPKYKGSELIELQKALPPSVIKNAASFVQHIPKISKDHADQIIAELKL